MTSGAGHGGSPRSSPRAEARLVVRYRFRGHDDFLDRYSANVSAGGIFIVSPQTRPAGTELSFEIQTGEGDALFRGKGVVRWTREHRPEQGQLGGIGVQFTELDDANRDLLHRMLARKGVAPAVAAPAPANEPVAPTPRHQDAPASSPGAEPAPPPPGLEVPPAAVEVEAAPTAPRPHARRSARSAVFGATLLFAGVAIGWGLRSFLGEPARAVPVATVEVRRDIARQSPAPAPAPDAVAIAPEPAPAATDAGMSAAVAPSASPAAPEAVEAHVPPAAAVPAAAAYVKLRPPRRQARPSAPAPSAPELPMPPPPEVLLDAEIRKAVDSRNLAVQLCYDRVLKERPDVRGRVTLEFDIAASGRTQKVTVVENTVRDWRVAYCLRNAFKDLRFQGIREELTVEVPFHLTPSLSP